MPADWTVSLLPYLDLKKDQSSDMEWKGTMIVQMKWNVVSSRLFIKGLLRERGVGRGRKMFVDAGVHETDMLFLAMRQ